MSQAGAVPPARPRVLVLSLSDLARDARVSRQVAELARHAEVTVAALAPGAPGVEFIAWPGRDLAAPLRWLRGSAKLLGLHALAYWVSPAHHALLRTLRGRHFDIIVANDPETLPVALAVPAARRLFDAHEFSPRQHEESLAWRLVSGRHADWLLRRHARHADAMLTVSHGLARAYAGEYGLRAVVMPNAASYVALAPSPVQPGLVRLVHHGTAVRARHLETMLDAMRLLDDRFRLELVLVPAEADYFRELQARAAGDERIRVRGPVSMAELPAMLNAHDVGLLLYPPVNFNVANCLPNKVFDFLQGRIPIATGPTPEVVDLVRRTGAGVVAVDFTAAALADALRPLDDTAIAALKQAADRAAAQESFEHYAAILVREVFGRDPAPETA